VKKINLTATIQPRLRKENINTMDSDSDQVLAWRAHFTKKESDHLIRSNIGWLAGKEK